MKMEILVIRIGFSATRPRRQDQIIILPWTCRRHCENKDFHLLKRDFTPQINSTHLWRRLFLRQQIAYSNPGWWGVLPGTNLVIFGDDLSTFLCYQRLNVLLHVRRWWKRNDTAQSHHQIKTTYSDDFIITQSCTHSHTNGGVSHAMRQPARQEQLGWGVSLRDTSTHSQEKLGI